MKTTQEIINETVEYYQGHPERRSIAYGEVKGKQVAANCMYFGSTPEQTCAIGRCLDKTKVTPETLITIGANTVDITELLEKTMAKSLDDLLLPKYQGHTREFWANLQDLHDISRYWDDEGCLTDSGKAYVESLQKATYSEV